MATRRSAVPPDDTRTIFKRMHPRPARLDEANAIVRLINTAYRVEQFFVEGDRTSPREVAQLMVQGTFLVDVDEANVVVGCIYLEIQRDHIYMGMLAVEPSRQGHGLGRRLIEEGEAFARRAGATLVKIHVVNLRVELLEFYSRLGYIEICTEPYVDRPITQPCHFVVMHKSLSDHRPAA
jgi:predicted N-acetyltransferase YhbS